MERCVLCEQQKHDDEPDVLKCLRALAERVRKLEKRRQPKRNLGDVRVKE